MNPIEDKDWLQIAFSEIIQKDLNYNIIHQVFTIVLRENRGVQVKLVDNIITIEDNIRVL